jgi:hypothetical protein
MTVWQSERSVFLEPVNRNALLVAVIFIGQEFAGHGDLHAITLCVASDAAPVGTALAIAKAVAKAISKVIAKSAPTLFRFPEIMPQVKAISLRNPIKNCSIPP